MGVRKQYRLACDFCKNAGPPRDTEAMALAAAGSPVAGVRRIHRSFYGDEVYACAACVLGNEDMKEWLEREEGA